KMKTDWTIVEDGVADMLFGTYGNLRIPARLQNIVRGRMRKIREALASEEKAPNAATHKVTQDLVERMTIGLDEAMRALGTRGAPSLGGGQNPGAPGAPTDEPDESGDESEGEQQAADEESALEELTKEHGGAIGEVEDLLRDAEDPKSLESIKEEAKKRADALR